MFVDRLPFAASGEQPRRRGRPATRASAAVLIIYALVLAGSLGLASAHWLTRADYPFGGVRVGPWLVWPKAGARDADPYTRAVNARTGIIPLAVGEGLVLRATADSAEQALDRRCTYMVGSVTPQARFWTLTLYDAAGRPVQTPLGRSGFTSAELLRDASGAFSISISPEARSGNWLMMPEAGEELSLLLRLYDSPASAGSASLDARALPTIERLECQP